LISTLILIEVNQIIRLHLFFLQDTFLDNMIRSCPILLRLTRQTISPLSSRATTALQLHYIRPFTSITTPGSNNYYDSQSGMHVAIHNEDEISVFAHTPVLKLDNLKLDPNRWNSPQEFQAVITSMQKSGFSGITLANNKILTNNNTLMAFVTNDFPVVSSEFNIFVPTSTMVHDTNPHYPDNIHLVLEYIVGTNNDRLSLTQAISEHITNGTKTTIAIVDHNHDPILTANGVASLIDDTGGGDMVWISSKSIFCSSSSKTDINTIDSKKKVTTLLDPDKIVTLCEELCYLDIPGSTMKSRLTVDLDLLLTNPTVGEEEAMVVEEFLMMGINKFVIQKEWLKWFHEILQRHGKSLR